MVIGERCENEKTRRGMGKLNLKRREEKLSGSPDIMRRRIDFGT